MRCSNGKKHPIVSVTARRASSRRSSLLAMEEIASSPKPLLAMTLVKYLSKAIYESPLAFLRFLLYTHIKMLIEIKHNKRSHYSGCRTQPDHDHPGAKLSEKLIQTIQEHKTNGNDKQDEQG